MGLIAAPRVRFIQRMEKKGSKKENNQQSEEEEDGDVETIEIGNVQQEDNDFNFNGIFNFVINKIIIFLEA